MRATLSLLALIAGAAPALADVNIYSQRQPELIQPLLDAFTKQTGIKVNIAFIQNGNTRTGTVRTAVDGLATAVVGCG